MTSIELQERDWGHLREQGMGLLLVVTIIWLRRANAFH